MFALRPLGLPVAVRFGLLAVLLFLPTTAHADGLPLTPDEVAYLNSKTQITMCVDPDWMPYERIDDSGNHIGIAADYFRVFESLIGTPITLVPTKTWTESVAAAKARKCDILSMLNESEERKKYLNFTRPYLRTAVVLVAREDVLYINGLSAMAGKTLGVVKGYIYEEIIRKQYPNIDMVTTTTMKDGLRLVSEGKIDAAIASLYIAARQIQEAGLTNLKIAGQTKLQNAYGIGVRNDDPILLSVLDKAVAGLPPEVENDILQRWFTVTFEQKVDYSLLWKVLAATAAVMAFLLYRWNTTRHFNRQLAAANAQLQKHNESLEKLSETDHLTGIFNRIHLDQALRREVSRCARYSHPLSIILLDIDHFKQVNDRHGHPVGDMVLIGIAELLRKRSRRADTFGRWGGEEFMLICPETDINGAATQAENLRKALAETPIDPVGPLTASFGVAQLQAGELERTLIARADEALYRAKKEGRNRVSLAEKISISAPPV